MEKTFATSRAKFRISGRTLRAHGAVYVMNDQEAEILAEAFDPENFPQTPDHWAECVEEILYGAGAIVFDEHFNEYMVPEESDARAADALAEYGENLARSRAHFTVANLI